MSTEATGKTLAAMMAEVQEWGRADGWYDSPVSFGEALAYLHSEVSEAFEAWRQWGLKAPVPVVAIGGKPEGVGSEFADVLIRLLDCCIRFGVDLEAEVRLQAPEYALSDSFPENVNTLHYLVARTWMAHQMGDDLGSEFACICAYVRQWSAEHCIDLEAEYNRKMTYNRANPRRHEKRQQ
jgi:NTP pyrophosphatase (non-canonical NTP hydrolase)